jgi:glutamate-1-semialdehyde 2,1-aminomutase
MPVKVRSRGAKARKIWRQCCEVIPGGVNSPVRAFRSVGGVPVIVKRAKGAKVWDCDGNSFIDYIMSWGPLILGHAPDVVVKAIERAAKRGTSYGLPTSAENDIARLITEAFPSIEKVRLVNSGTEAAMSAIRLARAFTGRKKILKFDGCYHGHADSLLVKAGSGVATFGLPGSAGVPEETVAYTLTARYNDLDSVRAVVKANRRGRKTEIACIIVEPVAGNMGVVPPENGFLSGLREIAAKEKILLIFDEVITGFRVAYGGAQERYGISADLTVLGKIIGGGLPVGAFGAASEIMDRLAPDGPVYQAGTLSGNPLAVAAGTATLKALRKRGTYAKLEKLGAAFEEGLKTAAAKAKVPATVNRVGSMMCAFLTGRPVRNYDDARKSDTGMFAKYHAAMLKMGVLLAPSQFEASFVSLAHSEADIAKTAQIAKNALKTAGR